MAQQDVESVLQEVIRMEGRVGQLQTERLELEQRVLVAQQRHVLHARSAPEDQGALEKAERTEEARLRRQIEATKAQVRAKEAELKELVENDPRAALVVKIEQGVDKYVDESRRLRRALHAHHGQLHAPAQQARPPSAELALAGMRAQVQQGARELAAVRAQTELLGTETARLQAQAAELRAALGHGGGDLPERSEPSGRLSEVLAQLEAEEAVAEERHRLEMAEHEAEQAALQAQLEGATRQIALLMAELPRYAELNAAGTAAQ